MPNRMFVWIAKIADNQRVQSAVFKTPFVNSVYKTKNMWPWFKIDSMKKALYKFLNYYLFLISLFVFGL